jgi:uncharacterized membrane protein
VPPPATSLSHQGPADFRSARGRRWTTALRWLSAVAFVAAGLNHFRNPTFYRQIVPPQFPAPDVLVAVSGVCEVAGGLGLLVRPLRRAAGWGLIALLVAVFPANVYLAADPAAAAAADLDMPRWLLWARLPLQPLFILGVWVAACRRERKAADVDATLHPPERDGDRRVYNRG